MKTFSSNIISVRKYLIDENSPLDKGVQESVHQAWSKYFEDR